MGKRILAGILISLLTHSLYAQKFFTREELEAVMNPALLEGAENVLRFDSLTIHAGTLSEDDAPSVYVFTCRNVSGRKLMVNRVRTTCGCTKAVVADPLLEPGEETKISITFNPFGHPGRLLTRAFVYVSLSDQKPVAALTIVGEVTPSAALWKNYRYAMGDLRLVNKQVDFGAVKRTAKRKMRIACANAGSRPLTVKPMQGFLPAYLTVRTEPETLQPSEEGSLLLELDGKKLPPATAGRTLLRVLLDGVSASPSDRTLKVSFETEGENNNE